MTPEDHARRQAGELLDVVELATRLEPALVPVPGASDTVCRRCRGTKDKGYSVCYRCNLSAKQLGGYSVDVIPISMSVNAGRLHDHLRQYKDGREACVRYRLATALGGLLGMFLSRHGRCLGEWDVVTTVPSLRPRAPGGHPLAELIARVQGLAENHQRLLVANPATADLSSRRDAAPARYLLSADVDLTDQRILLVDDTLTTGASLQSAAHALTAAGARSVQPIVLGRHLNADRYQPAAALLQRLRAEPWAWDRCGLCGPADTGQPQLL